MSFTLRLWGLTFIGLIAFTAWGLLHDEVVPGLTQLESNGVVVGVAWAFWIAGGIMIDRLHSRAERLAEKAARDDTVIQLAGGVAHEMNQPLTIIISTAELLARRNSESGDLRPYLHQLIQASERMTDIVQKLERATAYRSKPYVGGVKIVDIDNTSE